MNRFKERIIPLVVVLVGFGLRLLASTKGHNVDFKSYAIVANIVKHGGNVYAETTRYNYGPIWFHIIGVLNMLASILPGVHDLALKYTFTVFLGLIDLGIFFLLFVNYGKATAYLFFLNPISIIITGYHNQFDNLALFIGMVAVCVLKNESKESFSVQKAIGLFILGISLTTKHILFAFPFWLAIKQKGILNKLAVMGIPVSIFIIGFIPYWKEGQQGIIQNVLFYKSFENPYFFQLFVPEIIGHFFNAYLIWVILLGVFGIIFRTRNVFDSLLLYSCIFVATAPAVANQYLTIPVIFIAANPNPFLIAYTVIGTMHLMVNSDGLHIFDLQPIANSDILYSPIITMLVFGFIWHLWRQNILALIKKLSVEIKNIAT